jgi:hypothetical protein
MGITFEIVTHRLGVNFSLGEIKAGRVSHMTIFRCRFFIDHVFEMLHRFVYGGACEPSRTDPSLFDTENIELAYPPQIAVVIDGVWQIDPVQLGEQHNFNIAWIAG